VSAPARALRYTPLHERTAPLMEGQAWRRWAGHLVASSYELQHDREYHAIRNAAALIDVSPLYKYLVRGPDAARLLDLVHVRDIARMKVGQVMYSCWCDAAGKVIDDGTVARLDDTTFRMTSADPNLRWLHLNGGRLDATVDDVSDVTAALALQGPLSRTVLQQLTGDDLARLRYFRLTSTTLQGIPVTLSRTGYTGDLGYEIWVDADRAVALWDALVDAGTPYGITPTGILALDVARIEAGLMMLDVDYVSAHRALIEGQKSSPYELNLGWAVDLRKESFVGRDALEAEQAQGPSWRFVGIDVDWDSLEALYAAVDLPPRVPTVAWRTSVPLYADGVQVGYATSGCWSPLLKQYIALAHVQARYAAPGTRLSMEVTVEHHRKQALARVVKTPFFDPERKRA
jgi:aminomethyltransferase